jgi:hypothetical protein
MTRHHDFTKEDTAQAGKLVGRMLKFEPSLRATASDILSLSADWFKQKKV